MDTIWLSDGTRAEMARVYMRVTLEKVGDDDL